MNLVHRGHLACHSCRLNHVATPSPVVAEEMVAEMMADFR